METLKRYTTYLRPDQPKQIKLRAINGDMKDYQVIQAAVDNYLGSDEVEMSPEEIKQVIADMSGISDTAQGIVDAPEYLPVAVAATLNAMSGYHRQADLMNKARKPLPKGKK